MGIKQTEIGEDWKLNSLGKADATRTGDRIVPPDMCCEVSHRCNVIAPETYQLYLIQWVAFNETMYAQGSTL